MRLVFCILVVTILGCGDGGREKPDTVNVSGTVYLDGKPLADAEVNFVSEDGEFAAFGKTNAEGKYTLAQGAVPGKNKVYISKMEGEELDIELSEEEGMDAGQLEAMGMDTAGDIGPKELIAEEYSDPEKTKLEFEVPADGTDSADFRLQ